MAFVLTFSQEPLGLGSQSDTFCKAGLPVVVHTLSVLGVPHQAVLLALVLNRELLTVDRNHGDVTP